MVHILNGDLSCFCFNTFLMATKTHVLQNGYRQVTIFRISCLFFRHDCRLLTLSYHVSYDGIITGQIP